MHVGQKFIWSMYVYGVSMIYRAGASVEINMIPVLVVYTSGSPTSTEYTR